MTNTTSGRSNQTNPKLADDNRPTEAPPTEEKNGDEESMIVHRVNVTKPDGTPGVHEHGPMPVSEWAAYEKKNGL